MLPTRTNSSTSSIVQQSMRNNSNQFRNQNSNQNLLQLQQQQQQQQMNLQNVAEQDEGEG